MQAQHTNALLFIKISGLEKRTRNQVHTQDFEKGRLDSKEALPCSGKVVISGFGGRQGCGDEGEANE